MQRTWGIMISRRNHDTAGGNWRWYKCNGDALLPRRRNVGLGLERPFLCFTVKGYVHSQRFYQPVLFVPADSRRWQSAFASSRQRPWPSNTSCDVLHTKRQRPRGNDAKYHKISKAGMTNFLHGGKKESEPLIPLSSFLPLAILCEQRHRLFFFPLRSILVLPLR